MPRHLQSYYFGFEETGVDAVDEILEAVARAGSSYHSTDGWNDKGLGDDARTHVERIQAAANEAAERFRAGTS